MVNTDNAAPRATDPVSDAIAALTAAARQTRVRGAGTEHEEVEPVDFAEIACHVLTTVAANIGGVEDLLEGRPGSWEAEHVRNLVNSTAGDEPGSLLPYRTEPVQIEFDAEEEFEILGLTDLYYDQVDELEAVTVDENATVARVQEAERTLTRMGELWEADLAAYRDNYLEAARSFVAARGATCDVVLVGRDRWSELGDEVKSHAHDHARLPMTGAAPDFSSGKPADALRRSGNTYADRAR